MKVLLDPIYTSDPGHCASAVKMRKIVESVLAERQDVFFYWLYPERCTEEELEWFDQHPNIKYIPYPYSQDRLKEYMRLYKQMEWAVAFDGEYWDFDIMVTNRTTMVATIKTLATKISASRLNWSKRVFLIEDMPIMSFKKLLSLSHPDAQNLQGLVGYLTADTVAISAYWEKAEILRVGRDYLSPAQLRKIEANMVESTSVLVEKTGLKTKDSIVKMLKRERPFTMAYVGRMTQSQTRIPEIFDIMEKNWILKSGPDSSNLRCVISTVSKSSGRVRYAGKQGIPDWIEVHRPAREGFWELMQEGVDVFVFMSKEEDYSMSLMEPLILGCPAVLIKDKWSVGTVGPDYPFFVKNAKEAYAMVKCFYDDYPTMYKKFADWSTNVLTPLLHERNKTYICDVFKQEMADWQDGFDKYRADHNSKATNEIVGLLSEGLPKEIHIFDDLRRLGKEGKLNHLDDKLNPEFRERVRLGFQTDWNQYRLSLMARFGYEDASSEVGHLKLPN